MPLPPRADLGAETSLGVDEAREIPAAETDELNVKMLAEELEASLQRPVSVSDVLTALGRSGSWNTKLSAEEAETVRQHFAGSSEAETAPPPFDQDAGEPEDEGAEPAAADDRLDLVLDGIAAIRVETNRLGGRLDEYQIQTNQAIDDLRSRVEQIEEGGSDAVADRVVGQGDFAQQLADAVERRLDPRFTATHQRLDQVEARANDAYAMAEQAMRSDAVNGRWVLGGAIVLGLASFILAHAVELENQEINNWGILLITLAGVAIGGALGSLMPAKVDRTEQQESAEAEPTTADEPTVVLTKDDSDHESEQNQSVAVH